MPRNIEIGMPVYCSETKVIGTVINFYQPTCSEEQIMVKTRDGRRYHAPTRMWQPYGFGTRANGVFVDEVSIFTENPFLESIYTLDREAIAMMTTETRDGIVYDYGKIIIGERK